MAEACSTSGCYGLEVDVVDGEVTTIYFPNGGHNDISGAYLDESGSASGDAYTWEEGYSGEAWDIYVYDWEDEIAKTDDSGSEW